MNKRKDSSVKCVRDTRYTCPEDYRLPRDGRKWVSVCRLRLNLAHWLATFADPDGSNITVGVERMMALLRVSRRTVMRLLDDLQELGYLVNGKLTKFNGTRRRALNMAAILKTADVPDSPDVPDRNADVPDSRHQMCQIESADVPDSRVEHAKTALFGTLPSCSTTVQKQTDKPTVPGWVGKAFSDFNHAPCRLGKTHGPQFMAAIQQHGEVAVKLAWESFVKTGNYGTETKYPAYLFFNDLGVYLAAAQKRMESHEWLIANDPDYTARLEADIARQKSADYAFMTKMPPLQNEGDPREYLAEMTG